MGTLDQRFDECPGKLRLVVKQLPVHRQAGLSAEAAYAASAQGRFRELYDLMMVNQDPEHHARDGRSRSRSGPGLTSRRFAPRSTATFAAAVAADQAVAKQLDLEAIPAFVIHGKRVAGAMPITVLRQAIDQALAAQ